MTLCGKYIGDNDATCPQLTCIRRSKHEGLCDNVKGDGSFFQVAVSDAVDLLKSLDDESVALIVTDPAYESLEKHRATGTTTRLKVSDGSSNEWFDIFRNDRFPDFFRECYRVLAPNAHLYIMSDQETGLVTKPMAEAAGFKWWKFLTWGKTGRDMDIVANDDGAEAEAAELDAQKRIGLGYHYRNTTEWIGFYEKGKRKLNNLGVSDLLPRARVRDGYPTEKPVSLNRTLIEQSSSPGELVVDPFVGSGSCGEAALKAGRDFLGSDTSTSAVERAVQRLKSFGTEKAVATYRRQSTLFGDA